MRLLYVVFFFLFVFVFMNRIVFVIVVVVEGGFGAAKSHQKKTLNLTALDLQQYYKKIVYF